jgi:hypothetical protein
MPEFLGLESGEPAPLLLVEATDEKIHLLMELPIRVDGVRKTRGTLALVNLRVGHDTSSVCCPHRGEVIIRIMELIDEWPLSCSPAVSPPAR